MFVQKIYSFCVTDPLRSWSELIWRFSVFETSKIQFRGYCSGNAGDIQQMLRNATSLQRICSLACVTPRCIYYTVSETVSQKTKKSRIQRLKDWTPSQMERWVLYQICFWLCSPVPCVQCEFYLANSLEISIFVEHQQILSASLTPADSSGQRIRLWFSTFSISD